MISLMVRAHKGLQTLRLFCDPCAFSRLNPARAFPSRSACPYSGFGFSRPVLLGRRDLNHNGIEIAQEFPQSFHRYSLVIAMNRGAIDLVR